MAADELTMDWRDYITVDPTSATGRPASLVPV